MNHINATGNKILELKKELLNDYPKIVHSALVDSATKMLETAFIDKNVYSCLTDSSITVDSLEQIILNDNRFIKTKEEVVSEMKAHLEECSDQFNLTNFIADVDGETESFQFKKKLLLGRSFFEQHFCTTEDILANIMSDTGFGCTYCYLRFPKIIQEFLDNKTVEFQTIYTKTFLVEDETDPLENKFGIYLIVSLPLEDSLDKDTEQKCFDYVNTIFTEIDGFFDEKTRP